MSEIKDVLVKTTLYWIRTRFLMMSFPHICFFACCKKAESIVNTASECKFFSFVTFGKLTGSLRIPSSSASGSQASPTPSLSASSWPLFGVNGQLSWKHYKTWNISTLKTLTINIVWNIVNKIDRVKNSRFFLFSSSQLSTRKVSSKLLAMYLGP